MCSGLSGKLYVLKSKKFPGLILISLLFMHGIQLKPHNLVGKWLWRDLCLKMSPFGYNCIRHNICEYVKRECVCVCVLRACVFIHRPDTGYHKTYAVKPQRWGKTTTDDSTSVISGKQACGVLFGVKPQPWELKLCTTQVLSLLKDEREKAGRMQSRRARGWRQQRGRECGSVDLRPMAGTALDWETLKDNS